MEEANSTDLKRLELKNSKSYRLINKVRRIMDKSILGIGLDPIIGLIPNVGDAINFPLMLPYLYFALVKVKSVPLALAVTFNLMLDVLIGTIPFLGIIMDFFFKGFQRNHDMILGFVDGDENVIKRVNRNAIMMAVLIVLLVALFLLLVKVSIFVISWLWELCQSVLAFFI
ncbi:MAG: DUF4112 domain-containing protein [Paludibacteraceae bacterium]|nr:DUF4112 domain-containing protein [Paludibacteraceae bacterium]